MAVVSMKQLLEAGVHLGHQTRRWNPKMATYIYTEQLKTLNYAISQIISAGISRAGAGAASVVFMMILPIAVFMFSQSNIVETMSSSGIKE